MMYYNPAFPYLLSALSVRAELGLNPEAIDLDVLNGFGYYPVNQTTPTGDPNLYTYSASYAISGNYADQSWTYVPRPLPEAKEFGSAEEKVKANNEEASIVSAAGLSTDLLTAVSSQVAASRPSRFQDTLNEMTAVSDQLDTNLTAIDAATTVDEINNIVNPPTGTIQIYRTGATLEESFYVSFNSVTLTEADTELYIPGSATVIPYDTLNSNFPQTPAAFSPGDFLIQIRVTSSAQVIKEFLVDTTPTDVAF
jgi:hypothetical protein